MVIAHSGTLKWTSIDQTEILAAGGRLEAGVYNIEARHARELVQTCGLPSRSLTDPQLVVSVSYPGRFRRNYVSRAVGLPFILPSQITDLNPLPAKWVYGLNDSDLAALRVTEGDILLTRSGTIGQCAVAGSSLAGKVMSDDLIRIVPQEKYRGYLYTFLLSKTGQLLLTTSNYGAVVQHIEPDHLAGILVPIPDDATITALNDSMTRSYELRDESSALISQADDLLVRTIDLPPLEAIPIDEYRHSAGVVNIGVPVRELDGRLDASYHSPLAAAIEALLMRLVPQVTTIADSRISSDIILPGRFKRVYVEDGFGVPFIGGKQIGRLDPRTGKNLSLQEHGKRIREQLTIRQNQVLITCSGTIGRTNIAPKHWAGWTSSQHIIRVDPAAPWMAGYLYSWLSSDYGRELIRRFTYGSVVDEVDDTHVGRVMVPLLAEERMREIGQLVLQANDRRYEAFTVEQQALKTFDNEVLGLSA